MRTISSGTAVKSANVTLRCAQGEARRTKRSFAALRMTARTPLKSAHEKPYLQMSNQAEILVITHKSARLHVKGVAKV
jgi:hypothetical protein